METTQTKQRPLVLEDETWQEIEAFLHNCPRAYVGKSEECRRFIEGCLWILRTGAQWRFLPDVYGKWNTVYKRFARWCDNNIWYRMHQHFIDAPDLEYLLADSSIVRAHPCAAGAPGKKGGNPNKP